MRPYIKTISTTKRMTNSHNQLLDFWPACAEYLAAEFEARLFEPIHKLGPEASRHQRAAAIVTGAGAAMIGRFVDEYILQRDGIAFQPLQFRNLDDFAAAILETALLDDQLHGTGNLAADHVYRQVHAGHQRQRFQAGHAVARRVGVDCRERSVVAGIHGLEHVQRFTATALADHDAIRAHTQAALD